MHDLRHAHASWLLAGGGDLKAVMDRLGHTQIQTTPKYLHALPDADDKALEAFTRVRHRAIPDQCRVRLEQAEYGCRVGVGRRGQVR